MKKLIIFMLIAFLIMFPFEVLSKEVDQDRLTYFKAKTQMLKNNKQISNASKNVFSAEAQYKNVLESYDRLNNYIMIWGNDIDDYQEMELLMQRDYSPVVAKYNWIIAQKNEVLTKSKLIIDLRNRFRDVLSAQNDYKHKQLELDVEKKSYTGALKRFEKGLISVNEKDEAEYAYLQAQYELDASKRNLENTKRKLNELIANPINYTLYDVINLENLIADDFEPVEYFIAKALENRIEIFSINRDIELKNLQASIMRIHNVHEIYRLAKRDYSEIMADLDILKIRLQEEKQKITQEIKSAYNDIKKVEKEIDSFRKQIDIEKRKLKYMEKRYELGSVSLTEYEKAKNNLIVLEDQLDLILYDYNTKLMKFEYAYDIGPAY